jgi:putative peptidoglycan lipid II flippase
MTAVEDRRGSTRAAGIVGMAILSSRVLGLIREMVFAGLFGAGKNLDAFLMAFRLPNLLRDLFAEGALSTAFITTFSKKIAVEGDESAWRLANKVATLTAVFMSVVTLLGIVFAPQLVDLSTWGSWLPDKTALTILLTRIMWPFMLLVSLAALVMGMLNAKHVFGPPAMASSYFNLGSIIAGVAIGWWLDPHFGARSRVRRIRAVFRRKRIIARTTRVGQHCTGRINQALGKGIGRSGENLRVGLKKRSGYRRHYWCSG